MENADYAALERRIGRSHLSERLLIQAGNTAKLLHQGEGFFRIERYVPIDALVALGLKLAGLGGLVRRNFLGVRVVTQEWRLPRLPEAFDGFRLLQLTDLHLDLCTDLTPVIAGLVRGTPHDAAVVTGDYRNKTEGHYEPCMREMAKITRELASDRWGILGNHDFIEMVPSLEASGLPILLNEAAAIRRGNDELWIAGIDDPHFYRTHDFAKSRSPIPSGACAILLAHSPEVYAEAEPFGFDLQLSGHTHGGQLCLPGGRAVIVPCKVPKPFIRGRWRHGQLQGYTSPGTGSCAVAARLFCPPEITLHVLKKSSKNQGAPPEPESARNEGEQTGRSEEI
jgi:predicted MPP superfamily phosphohydrolase